jgi:hypothetical protein
MTLLDMQRVLSRILTDKAFQRSFIEGDEPDPAAYRLTGRELSSLRGLRWDRVGLHAELLAHGRLELALKSLPLTRLLLHGQLYEHLDRFCAEYPPTPEAASHAWTEGSRLCDFATKLISEEMLRPGWAADLVRYERILLALATSAEAAASAIRISELNDEQPGPEPGWPSAHLVPVTGPHAEVASFSYPLVDLIPMLQDGHPPISVHRLERPLLLLFYKAPRGPVRIVRINEPTAALINSCDGDQTITGVTDLLGAQFGSGIQARAAASFGWLRENGVVTFRKRP